LEMGTRLIRMALFFVTSRLSLGLMPLEVLPCAVGRAVIDIVLHPFLDLMPMNLIGDF